MNCRSLALACVAALITGGIARAQDVLDLPVGDPARREKTVAVMLDTLVDTADGAVLTPAQVAARLGPVDLLFVGESHTSIDFHRAQQRMIEALIDAGRDVMIGLEMFPVTAQEPLDRWSHGELDEDTFLEQSHWYEHWGYSWDYYRRIFLLARARGVRVFALNAPRDVVTAVRRKGIDRLDAEESAYLPPRVDTDSPEHLRLFKAYFAGDDSMHAQMSPEQWQSMFAAQCTWDATMGYNAVRRFRDNASDRAIMVVLIGSGHVSYGLGIERQARNFFGGRTASLIPVPMLRPGSTTARTVRASYADFVWGIPAERAPLYPSLGISTREAPGAEGVTVILVQPDSLGETAGIRAGDRLVSLDSTRLPNKETFNRLMAGKRWGDAVALRVARGEGFLDLDVPLRRDRQ